MIALQETPISKFIQVVTGAKDIGLIIGDTEKDTTNYSFHLKEAGFQPSITVDQLFKQEKSFVVLAESTDKDILDFIAQYPTGQIEIFDGELMQSRIISPDYTKRGFVVLITKDTMEKLDERGYSIRSYVGPALQ